VLPKRTTDDENAFVDGLMEAAPDVVLDAAVAAVDDGRPMLAARIVGLLPAGTDLADAPALERAQQAARFVLLAPADRRGPVIAELEAALAGMKSRYFTRARNRQRERASGHQRKRDRRRKPRKTRG
jgi:hypothetical protein